MCVCLSADTLSAQSQPTNEKFSQGILIFYFILGNLRSCCTHTHTHMHKYLYMHAVGLMLFSICFQCSRAQSLSNACARYKAAEYITVSQREREHTPFRIVCARSNHGALHYASTHNYTYTHRHSGVELALEVALAHVIASIKQQQQDDLWQPFPALKWQQKQ